MHPSDPLTVEVRRHRRTALVTLSGELDLVTISQVADTVEALDPTGDGVRHIVLDLRDLTFMDLAGLRELLRQNDDARTNHHNLAFVRGPAAIDRVLTLTNTAELLVLVDHPDDLVPPVAH